MNAVATALLPIFGVITLGWVLRRSGIVPADFWPKINRLSYQALLPALLFSSISTTSQDLTTAIPFLAAATLAFVTMGIIAMGFVTLPVGGPAFTSVFQGGVRWNGFVLLALSSVVFGPEGAALASLVFAPTVPIINMMCVAVLSVWGASDEKQNIAGVIRRIAVNPLIIACIAGIFANTLGWFQTGPIADTAALAGRAALPMILLAIGAGLDFTALKARPALLGLTISLKLVVAPLVFWGLGTAFGVTGMPLALLVAIGSTPGAAAGYVLASEMGGDARLMAGHVTATTLLAFVALPLWIGFAGG